MEKYIIQKAQKIASALYIITDLIKDSDAMKWEIRETGLSFVSAVNSFNESSYIDKSHANNIFNSTATKLTSLINISIISSLISKMNGSIILNEIESLVSFVNKQHGEEVQPAGYILSDSFFNTDSEPSDTKSQDSNTLKSSYRTLRTEERPVNKGLLVKDKKNNRQENIINLLKKDSNLTIKDFAKVIKDCSEKTIQRELIELVEKGVVKKVGERRWSTYSLN